MKFLIIHVKSSQAELDPGSAWLGLARLKKLASWLGSCGALPIILEFMENYNTWTFNTLNTLIAYLPNKSNIIERNYFNSCLITHHFAINE